MAKQYKILLVDDDKDLCGLLKRELERDHFITKVCHDGESGLAAFNMDRYQLVILDIMLPSLSGLEILAAIRKNHTVPVLMLTARDSEADKVSGLRLGADDYLTKPFLLNEFTARVHSLIRRYTVFNSPDRQSLPLTFKDLIINPHLRTVTVHDKSVRLTAKEFDLLFFLASDQGRVYTKEQIYNHVWKDDYSFDDSNIMSFISKLRKKLNNNGSGPDYIQTIHGIGYRFNMEV